MEGFKQKQDQTNELAAIIESIPEEPRKQLTDMVRGISLFYQFTKHSKKEEDAA